MRSGKWEEESLKLEVKSDNLETSAIDENQIQNSSFQTEVTDSKSVLETSNFKPETSNSQLQTSNFKPETSNSQLQTSNFKPETSKVSAFSLAGIKAKKELLEAQKGEIKPEIYLPSEPFTELQMQEQWFKYADKLGNKGHRIMESMLRISSPKSINSLISYELPNEGSKLDFEKEKNELTQFLRIHLHNHDLEIEVIVNEEIKSKIAFTPIDKFNRLIEINPNLELLKKMFDLDF